MSLHNHKLNKILVEFIVKNYVYFIGLFFFILVFVIIFWGTFKTMEWIKYTHYSKLSQLIVNGKLHYTTYDDIHRAVSDVYSISRGFAEYDVHAICYSISQLPWIQGVSIRKQWPNILKIYIIEYKPIVIWNDIQMLDSSGTVFQVPMDRISLVEYNNLPVLYGPEGSEQNVLTGYRILYETIQFTDFKLRSVKMDNRYSWEVVLQKNIKLELGRTKKVEKLQRFIRMYPFFLQSIKHENRCVSYIDLRYDYGFAVGWIPCSN